VRSYRELLRRVREVAIGAYAHQDLPFEKLVEELQPERDLSRNPIFQVMFSVQNAPSGGLGLSGVSLRQVEVKRFVAKFDLAVDMFERGDRIAGVLIYSLDLFEKETAAHMCGQMVKLLESIANDPDAEIGTLGIVPEAERRQLGEWNDTNRDYGSLGWIHHAIEHQAAVRPDAPAVSCGERTLTYRRLNESANQLANYLRGRGVTREGRIGVSLNRGEDLIVALVAVMKSGAAYVPMDIAYPEQRLRWMIENSGVDLLLTRRDYASRLGVSEERTLILDEIREEVSRYGKNNPECDEAGDSLAYMIYTSGTTGRPKAVMIEHRNLANVIKAGAERLDITHNDVMACVASYSFDIFLLEMLSVLVTGGSLVLMTEEEVMDVGKLADAVRRVTVLHCVPSLMRQVITEITRSRREREYKALRKVLTGGDTVPADLLVSVRKVFDRARTFVLYGPTESTIISTAWDPAEGRKVRIGGPLGNTSVWTVDEQAAEAGIGIRGEIWIGGAGVGRGYHNQPALTAERFVPDPFSAAPGSRLYRTGDLGRVLGDGTIEFLGRRDHQVKIRGYRVELDEIAAVLREHHAVHDAVVLGAPDEKGEVRLAAYVATPDRSAVSANDLRKHLRERVPEHMVPATFIFLESLPLTSTGKLDRRGLPPPEALTPEPAAKYVAPSSDLEHEILAMWRQVLKLEKMGVDDNFFDLGGHSLTLAEVHSHLRMKLKQDISLLDLFKFPTIGSLARHLGRTLGRTSSFDKTRERAQKRRKHSLR
jgi:amino acid adenylation domain-containing protein